METKVCVKCNVEKLTTDFYKSKTVKGGLTSSCIECVKENARIYRENNKDKVKEMSKQYYEKNKKPKPPTPKKIKIITPIEFKETKICHKCKTEKKINQFHKNKSRNDGLSSNCKKCRKVYSQINNEKITEQRKQRYHINKDRINESRKEYTKKYRINNKEKIKQWRENNKEKIKQSRENNKEYMLQYSKEYYQKNKDKITERGKQHYKNNKENKSQYYQDNKDKIRLTKRKWIEKNKDTVRKKHIEYTKKRMQSDPLFRLGLSIRKLINIHIKTNGYTKKSRTHEILGCSFEEFKSYIESKFQPWMNWDNYGNPKDGIYELNKTWDFDHIIPISSAKTEEELIKLNHYTNLQPLCSLTNRNIKKDKF
jgi:hypothetical protein